MAGGGTRGLDRVLAALTTAIDRADGALAVFDVVSRRLRRDVPFAASVWRTTDPMTGLMTAPLRTENLEDDGCGVYWESELLGESPVPFHVVSHQPVPASGLHEATAGRPARSALYREYLRPRGFDDELRAVFRAGGLPWGTVSLLRERGMMPFSPAEIDLVAALCEPIGRRMRSFACSISTSGAFSTGPGLLLFDATNVLCSVNDEAREQLKEFDDAPGTVSGHGLFVPAWVVSTALRARAVADGRDLGASAIRVRARDGRWLRCRATCLTGADGRIQQTAVVLESAPAEEITPLLVAAHQLTPRELEVTRMLARGLGTEAMARALSLSPYTVRDHIKSAFAKTHVSSRGELVAKLFHEHNGSPAAATSLIVAS